MSAVIITVLALTAIPLVPAKVSGAADSSSGEAARDIVEFGSYWQTDTNGDGTADEKDTKKPIRWLVIDKSGDTMFLLAESVLDAKA